MGRLEEELARLKEEIQAELAASAHERGVADQGERVSYWHDLFGRWRGGEDLSGADPGDVAMLDEYGPVFVSMIEEGVFDAHTDDSHTR